MAAESYDSRDRLVGRGRYGPEIPALSGPDRLWQYFVTPSAQNSILVYRNGDVWEKDTFTTDEINDPDVYVYIPGGSDWRKTDDAWLTATLEAVGYTFEPVEV